MEGKERRFCIEAEHQLVKLTAITQSNGGNSSSHDLQEIRETGWGKRLVDEPRASGGEVSSKGLTSCNVLRVLPAIGNSSFYRARGQ